ncbi:MAG TPA: DUF3177 family protein [Xenococcaceae cyanobacterium]
MSDIWFRPLVWMDYRLAVLFLVIAPLILLIWVTLARKEAMQRLLIIYWRVASLLMITVYILIPGWKIGFFTGIIARLLIPLALWFWVDINEEIKDLPNSKIKFSFTSWRWATTIYCILGLAASTIFIPCGIADSTLQTAFCQVWLEVPQTYRQVLHNNPDNEGFLGFMGMVGLCIYALYLAYFLLVRIGKQGRSALEQ